MHIISICHPLPSWGSLYFLLYPYYFDSWLPTLKITGNSFLQFLSEVILGSAEECLAISQIQPSCSSSSSLAAVWLQSPAGHLWQLFWGVALFSRPLAPSRAPSLATPNAWLQAQVLANVCWVLGAITQSQATECLGSLILYIPLGLTDQSHPQGLCLEPGRPPQGRLQPSPLPA